MPPSDLTAALEALERMEKAATPGPWLHRYFLGRADWPVVIAEGTGHIAGNIDGEISDADAALIAAARNSLPMLIALGKLAIEAADLVAMSRRVAIDKRIEWSERFQALEDAFPTQEKT
jgi:type III secretion system FlhB-like substrate exporter